ncbi:helix-turn-helix domain-containing protein [Chitinophaga sp. sic0106]|uniref:helix-turn-helix domain-containing protein n=1 Tax=Chitinophaga sp. sic0106 TaxID=2854785 RepID=UPI001C4767BC|nr:helix-turn-helix transcriptional regulator [Chitinophaga sp. sic0106]MBV7532376.1 helix-turn-helix transcriptional regulator [Chitinophaga sp. sic0106]
MPEKNPHITKAFGANLRRLRLARKLTQVEVAFEADMEPSYMTRLENGKTDPSLSTVYALADALDVSPRELLPDLSE